MRRMMIVPALLACAVLGACSDGADEQDELFRNELDSRVIEPLNDVEVLDRKAFESEGVPTRLAALDEWGDVTIEKRPCGNTLQYVATIEEKSNERATFYMADEPFELPEGDETESIGDATVQFYTIEGMDTEGAYWSEGDWHYHATINRDEWTRDDLKDVLRQWIQ